MAEVKCIEPDQGCTIIGANGEPLRKMGDTVLRILLTIIYNRSIIKLNQVWFIRRLCYEL